MKSKRLKQSEEIFNSVSHGTGVLISVACLVILLVFAGSKGNSLQIVSCSIFGSSMILLYLASTIFHGVKNIRLKHKLNRWDHSMIYVLIAGTYTPVALTILAGTIGWVIFAVIWALAVAGVIYKLFFYNGGKTERKISAFLYVFMGWIIVAAIVPLIQKAMPATLWFLLAGGLSYSVGVVFYLWQRLPFAHGIFHLFIIAGSISHFFAILVTLL